MTRSVGQLVEPPNPKKPTALRGAAGVWDRESGDHIKGCYGAWIYAIRSLAGAGGWNITNVAAFSVFPVQFGRTLNLFGTALDDGLRVSSSINPDFQHELWIRLFMIHRKCRPARP